MRNKLYLITGTCLLSVYQGVQSCLMSNPSFLKEYLVAVTGTLPSVSPLLIIQYKIISSIKLIRFVN